MHALLFAFVLPAFSVAAFGIVTCFAKRYCGKHLANQWSGRFSCPWNRPPAEYVVLPGSNISPMGRIASQNVHCSNDTPQYFYHATPSTNKFPATKSTAKLQKQIGKTWSV